MQNIQSPKMVELQQIENFKRQTLGNLNYINSFEPTYSKLSRLSPKITDQHSLSRIKSGGLSSTRSKGLTLSLKKDIFPRKQESNESCIFNPQNLQESDLIRRKTASTLVKTSHTIHGLGGSRSRSKDGRNKSTEISQEKNILNQNFSESYHMLAHSLGDGHLFSPEGKKIFDSNRNREYNVKITPPKQINFVDQSKRLSQQSKQSKLGKISELKKKGFIRTQKKQSSNIKNNSIEAVRNKIMNRESFLKSSNKNLEVKTRRQFLESYIEKPMINSIIVSGNIDNLIEEPESPVLRLKKRLEMNSINCIFQKETLVSHQVNETKTSRIQIEESLIVHRNVSDNLRPLMPKINLFFEGQDAPYKLYLGQQKHSNLILTVKEMPLEYFEKFARQIRIYQEIESNRIQTKNILQLIKYSTDFDKHLFIKEPFTETLHDYLENFVLRKINQEQFENVVNSILRIIKKILDQFQQKGIFLKRKFTLNDFVFVFLNLKFENMEAFELGVYKKIEKENVLSELKQEMYHYFNRVSSGSMDF